MEILIGPYHNSSEPGFDPGCVGAAPTGPAKSITAKSVYKTLIINRTGRRISSVHRLKSGMMRTACLWCSNILCGFAVNPINRIV